MKYLRFLMYKFKQLALFEKWLLLLCVIVFTAFPVLLINVTLGYIMLLVGLALLVVPLICVVIYIGFLSDHIKEYKKYKETEEKEKSK